MRHLLLPFTLFLLAACAAVQSEPTPAPFVPDYSMVARATYDALPPLPTVTPGGDHTVSYAGDIQPLFNRYCLQCHGGIANMWLTDYEHVMAGSANGALALPGDAENSPLYDYVAQGLMPPFAERLPDAEIETLRTWIEEGALNN